jgi:Leucine-rich repeat (LRR) protein
VLTGTIPPSISKLDALTRLSLSNNNLKGTLPNNIGFLPSLTYLSVSNNFIGSTLPNELGQLLRVEQLSLSNNDFKGALPPQIGNCLKLNKLYLNNNPSLSGVIPSTYGLLSNIQYMYGRFSYNRDISNTSLSGPIPDGWSPLALTTCNLGADVCSNGPNFPVNCG